MAAEWFHQTAGKTMGPVPAAQLKQLAKAQTVAPDTPVRRNTDGQWVKARRVEGVFETTGTPSPQPPASPPSRGSFCRRADRLARVLSVQSGVVIEGRTELAVPCLLHVVSCTLTAQGTSIFFPDSVCCCPRLERTGGAGRQQICKEQEERS